MPSGRRATILRVLKPIAAGVALAYLATAFVDKPAPVHFQPENPYAAKQQEITETQADLVTEKNIMKLGSPLSVSPDESVSGNNPLAGLENMGEQYNATMTVSASQDVNATGIVRKGVEAAPETP